MMDKPVDRVMFSAIVSETGEQVNELQHKHYVIHSIDAQTPNGARIEPRIVHSLPSEEVQAFYCEYVWNDQGDGK
jgi:hypothetical protein